ncbi:MAG TPA: macro domain-containing protein [Gemmatimonadales bacterium]|nr:macro domain-containing protein [Gemmatimonadales bacterium]
MSIVTKLVDITTLPVDAIINAANERLLPGAGVSAAIHAAAGPELAEACERIGFCPTGEARITAAFSLPSRFVVHAVGPVWQGGDRGEDELLAKAVRAALLLAHMHRAESAALPAIATGIFGFPIDRAARIIVRAAREQLATGQCPPSLIIACFSDEARDAFEAALATDDAFEEAGAA